MTHSPLTRIRRSSGRHVQGMRLAMACWAINLLDKYVAMVGRLLERLASVHHPVWPRDGHQIIAASGALDQHNLPAALCSMAPIPSGGLAEGGECTDLLGDVQSRMDNMEVRMDTFFSDMAHKCRDVCSKASERAFAGQLQSSSDVEMKILEDLR